MSRARVLSAPAAPNRRLPFISVRADLRSNFAEALRVTTKAKSKFAYDLDDLFDRGRRLIAQSVEAGVTLMRAHVEVDESVHFACVDAGLRLRKLFRDICHIQIAGEAPSLSPFSSSVSCG